MSSEEKISIKASGSYRNAAVATDALGHVGEVVLEPALPLRKHFPAPRMPATNQSHSVAPYGTGTYTVFIADPGPVRIMWIIVGQIQNSIRGIMKQTGHGTGTSTGI